MAVVCLIDFKFSLAGLRSPKWLNLVPMEAVITNNLFYIYLHFSLSSLPANWDFLRLLITFAKSWDLD